MTGRRATPGPRAVALALALAISVVLGACGVPTGPESFDPISDDQVPNRLAEPSTSLTTTTVTTTTTVVPDELETTTVPAVPPPPVVIYFLSRDELSGVESAAPSFPPKPGDLIQLLENGPSEPFADLFESEIVPGLIVGTTVEAGIVTIELDPDLFDEIDEVADQRSAIAQMVLTFLGNLQFVGQARFTFDGEAIRVPTGESGFTDEPVSRDDYVSLIADSGLPAGDDPDPATTDAPDVSATTDGDAFPPSGTVG